MRSETYSALEALIRPKGFLYKDEVPKEHYEAFWTFTGVQTLIHRPDGRVAIPGSAWIEYVTWLQEERATPNAVTNTTKFEWRRRTGRWI